MPTKLPSSYHHDTILKCTTEPMCPFEPLRKFYALNASCYVHKTFIVHGSVTIVGHGNNITITSAGSGRIFDVANGAHLTIESVALSAKREEDGCVITDYLPFPNSPLKPFEALRRGSMIRKVRISLRVWEFLRILWKNVRKTKKN